MTDRSKRLAILILAVGFAASPIFSNGFGGFYRESFPVKVERWPAQPVGWAFSIWGLIYLALIATAAWAVARELRKAGFPREFPERYDRVWEWGARVEAALRESSRVPDSLNVPEKQPFFA